MAVFLAASLAVHVTPVGAVFKSKREPLIGLQEWLTTPTLSLCVGLGYITMAQVFPASVPVVLSLGQEIVGF